MNARNDIFTIARKRMIQEQLIGRGISSESVLRVMGNICRHRYVDEALKDQAYIDAPLSIGESQTISQPYIVALMTQALRLQGYEKILEIGTGCGYQTTVLSMLAGKVYTIERFKSLAMKARQRFKETGLKNIVMRVGDGSIGWQEAAPFDCVLLACATPEFPQIFIDQLRVGGVLVVPYDKDNKGQNLLRITKTNEGHHIEDLGECRFVPMIGKRGYNIS